MSPFRLAWLSLIRRRVPSLIVVVAIAISVACSGILLRLNHLSENRFAALGEGGDAIVGAKAGGIEILLGALNGEGDYPGYLPFSLFQSLRSNERPANEGEPGKENYNLSVIPFVYFGKLEGFRVAGTDETFFLRPGQGPIRFTDGRWASRPGELVLGAAVAKKLNLKVGDNTNIQSWIGGDPGESLPFRIVGLVAETNSAWDRLAYGNLESAKTILGRQPQLGQTSSWGPNVLNYFLIYLEKGKFSELSNLVNRRTVGQAVLVSAEKNRLRELTGTGERLGIFVTILILTLGALSVASMLLTRFDAMALQIAMLRALGYRKGEIGRWLLWEGFLLGVAAVILGAAFDAITFPVMRNLLSEALPPADLVKSHLWESAPIWAAGLLATTASVFFPLYRIYRQDVHFSLRN